MTDQEQANLDNLQRAHDLLLEGYCGMSVAYMASQLLELRRTVEKQAAVIRDMRSDSLKLSDRLDNAGRNFGNLERAFRALEKTVEQSCGAANSK